MGASVTLELRATGAVPGAAAASRRQGPPVGEAAAQGGAAAPPRARRSAQAIFRALRLRGRMVQRPYHLWVHAEADSSLAPFAFGEHIAAALRPFGIDAQGTHSAPLSCSGGLP